jgi:hypothetical protein
VGDGDQAKQLRVRRRLTRAVAEFVRGQLKDFLAVLGPLLRPRAVFGEHVQGSAKESVRGADTAFRELQAVYEAVAASRPFNLPRELKPPLEAGTSVVEFTPLEYTHAAKAGGESKTVTITSPLKWVLSYAGFGPRRLRELMGTTPTGNEIQQAVLQTLILHVVLQRQTGVVRILEALRLPVTAGRLPGFGEVPFALITSAVPTVRPPDEVIIENTEISGADVFEEVVDPEEISRLRDPLREKLLELVRREVEAAGPAEPSEPPDSVEAAAP